MKLLCGLRSWHIRRVIPARVHIVQWSRRSLTQRAPGRPSDSSAQRDDTVILCIFMPCMSYWWSNAVITECSSYSAWVYNPMRGLFGVFHRGPTQTTDMTSRKAHESLITSHSHVIGRIESSIRSLTWFLPWFRFRDADLASETLTALLNLTSLYHDVLIRRRLENGRPRYLSQILESDHSRFCISFMLVHGVLLLTAPSAGTQLRGVHQTLHTSILRMLSRLYDICSWWLRCC